MQPVSQARFAEHVGVSNAAISYACKPGGALHPAVVGKRIDVSHPAVAAYLKKHDVDPFPVDPGGNAAGSAGLPAAAPPVATPAPGKPHVRGRAAARETAKAAVTGDAQHHVVPQNIEQFADMTLRQLIKQFGTDIRFGDWLKSVKTIEDIRAKQLQNAELRGELIPRDFVRTHVIGHVEELHLKLINDATPTIVSTAVEHLKAGKPKEETDIVVGKIIASHIQRTKQVITRNIRQAGKELSDGQ